MNNLTFKFSIFCIVSILYGCSGDTISTNTGNAAQLDKQNIEVRMHSTTIDQSDWKGLSIFLEKRSGSIQADAITLSFKNGKIMGSTACNTFSGTYELSGNSLTLNSVSSTKRACADERSMALDYVFTLNISKVNGYTLNADELTLTIDDTPFILLTRA